ncbi:MAG TPA: glycosyltransferase family 4 protein [Pyrinomonadaceae bacterium]|nr:glycosyltransferase family 4 protein [Pyrinomonadaceae bacterium]
MNSKRLKVLLVPDSTYWVTGTIAKSIASFNPWIEATIASGPVIDAVFSERPELIRNFDLAHFICPYASREWLPRFRDFVPCVTSHHHVTDWEAVSHNLEGDAIVAGSREWSEDLRNRGADMSRVFVVPYGVDADAFRPPTEPERALIRARLKIPDGATVVGFFGKNSSNENDRKGIDVFIEAVVELNRRIHQLAVLIVGPGWKALVGSLRAAGVSCVWRPFVASQDELAKMYHALDFYWVTARVEGGPVPLLEAMSSEVCCLTTPVGIAREIVCDGENALLLPFNDAGAFVERTASLMSDAAERMRIGRAARQTILEEMHAGITTERVREVYAKALSVAQSRLGEPRFDMNTLAAGAAEFEDGSTFARNEVPLNGFPKEIHARVRMLEALAWSEHLILYHRQRTAALKLIARAWMTNPFSLLPPRVILRRFMPTRIVQKIVRLKNGARPKLKELPG